METFCVPTNFFYITHSFYLNLWLNWYHNHNNNNELASWFLVAVKAFLFSKLYNFYRAIEEIIRVQIYECHVKHVNFVTSNTLIYVTSTCSIKLLKKTSWIFFFVQRIQIFRLKNIKLAKGHSCVMIQKWPYASTIYNSGKKVYCFKCTIRFFGVIMSELNRQHKLFPMHGTSCSLSHGIQI